MIDLNEIKKLPVADRLQLIDELWRSLEESEEPEDVRLRGRLEAYERGELTFVSWDEAKVQIEEELKNGHNTEK